MCLLLEKARKDYDTAVYMQKLNDEYTQSTTKFL